MRVLIIGDVVGRPGRRALQLNLPALLQDPGADFVIANGENAAGGYGITKEVAKELFSLGVDVITTGNHIWDKKEIYDFIASEPRIIRPANYPPGVPGVGAGVFETRTGRKIGVLNLSGRVFMPNIDCPFRKADELLEELNRQVKVRVLDFHAEATSEKMAMGWYLAGRISVVCGTHTHVQTADERILPGGTAYITDVGMTGPVDSVIGVKKEIVVEKFLTGLPKRLEVASGLSQFNALWVEIDDETGEALQVRRVQNYE